MGGVSGDFAKLARLQQRMNQLAGVDVRAMQIAAPEISSDLAGHFAARESPYGDGWKGSYDLVESGALRAGATNLKASGRRGSITLPNHGRFQNPRQFMLRSGEPSPAVKKIVETATDRAVRDVMGVR